MTADATPSLPERVRAAAAAVAAGAQWVAIDHDRLRAYAATIPVAQACRPTLEPGDLPPVGERGTVAWVLTVNAVNFGSGFFPVLRKRPGLSGSKTVFAALRDRFAAAGPLTVDDLTSVTADGCAELFGQDPTGPAAELMAWFASAWRALGAALRDRFDGDPMGLVAAADGSAAALAQLLAAIDGWHDAPTWHGREVPLFKRAQIVPAHLAMAFRGEGPGRFGDLDRLTIFADNLVPHVLRIDGVLRFRPDLVARIDHEELLEPGSPEEVEIRAVAVHAAELLVAELRAAGHPATAMGLDQVLWARGGEPRYKAHPRHRARSTAY
jgi:hypothetical protein